MSEGAAVLVGLVLLAALAGLSAGLAIGVVIGTRRAVRRMLPRGRQNVSDERGRSR